MIYRFILAFHSLVIGTVLIPYFLDCLSFTALQFVHDKAKQSIAYKQNHITLNYTEKYSYYNSQNFEKISSKLIDLV